MKDKAAVKLPVQWPVPKRWSVSKRWSVPKRSSNAVVGACVYRTRTRPSYTSTALTVIHFISSYFLIKHMASGKLRMWWPVPER